MIGLVSVFAGLVLAAPETARGVAPPNVAQTPPPAAAGGHVSDMPMPDIPPAAAAGGAGMTLSKMMKMTTEEIMMPAPKMPKQRKPR